MVPTGSQPSKPVRITKRRQQRPNRGRNDARLHTTVSIEERVLADSVEVLGDATLTR